MNESLAPRDLAFRHELTVEEILAQAGKIARVMEQAMEEGVHYGTIPHTPKPTLYKAGAEKLNLLFRFDPQYQSVELREGEHLTVKSVCTLWHIPTGLRFGSGEGSCSTRESKYAWRKGERKCPKCGREGSILKGKAEYGGGWLCWQKREGCGAKFADGDAAIEGQVVERVPNPDLADQYNTVLKMANKRALVAAVLNCTAASDIFTQDLEDEDESQAKPEEPKGPAQPAADSEAVITEPQVKRFSAIATGSKWTDEQVHDLLAGARYNSRKEIKVKDYDALVERLKKGPPGTAKQGTLA